MQGQVTLNERAVATNKMEGDVAKDAGKRPESKTNAASSKQDPQQLDFSEVFSTRALLKDIINGASLCLSQSCYEYAFSFFP